MKQKNNGSILSILWLAMAQSHVIFGGVSYFILSKIEKPSVDPIVIYTLFGVAISMGFVSWMVYKKGVEFSLRRPNTPDEKPTPAERAFSLHIIAWAVCETVSICGLLMVSMFGAAALPQAFVLFVVGIGLHLLERPKFRR